MTGILFAIVGGALITLQSVVNSRVGQDIGIWQATAVAQLTGFIAVALILAFVRNANWQGLRTVRPLYLASGALATLIMICSIVSLRRIGVTLSTSLMLIAQLGLTFFIDRNGWFDVEKKEMGVPQYIGIGMMIVGVAMLR